MAEIQACTYGITLCCEIGFNNIELELDSLVLVNWLKYNSYISWKYFLNIAHIKSLINYRNITVRHI
ncbi:hypothetical protein AXF42_Ash019411 [Apostasia shenzhenica]|uniref:RNase H type-1 domain-containing protein n=1 Tax=Apostasia shenzhenica TaxID=1088818 RepID=A0A2I0B4W5_9ASPA|nr:hypothetical protein AXF42_Ash019411 [Apostasia shenzhenica]